MTSGLTGAPNERPALIAGLMYFQLTIVPYNGFQAACIAACIFSMYKDFGSSILAWRSVLVHMVLLLVFRATDCNFFHYDVTPFTAFLNQVALPDIQYIRFEADVQQGSIFSSAVDSPCTCISCRRLFRHGKAYRKCGALSRCAVNQDITAMPLDELVADTQAEACSGSDLFCREKRLEYP